MARVLETICEYFIGVDFGQKQDYTARALEALRAAVKENYRDAIALETDPELDLLRPQPDYQAILAVVKSRS